MRSLEYVPGVAGYSPISLSDSHLTVGQATGLRSLAWSYTLGTSSISSVTRAAREATLTVSSRNPEMFDLLSSIFDAEMDAESPGKLVVDHEWSQRCYVSKTSTSAATIMVDSPSTQSWTVVLLDGVWRCYGATVPHGGHVDPTPSHPSSSDGFLDLPTDTPFDLTSPAATGSNSHIYTGARTVGGSNFILRIYGPCANPGITIGSNMYQVHGHYADGDVVTVDSVEHTIKLVNSSGVESNIFEQGERGNGKDSGSYIFQKIQGNNPTASSNGSFRYDVTLIEEKSDPTWL